MRRREVTNWNWDGQDVVTTAWAKRRRRPAAIDWNRDDEQDDGQDRDDE